MKYKLLIRNKSRQASKHMETRRTLFVILFTCCIFVLILLSKRDVRYVTLMQSSKNSRSVHNNFTAEEQLQLQTLLKCSKKELIMKKWLHGNYLILQNLIRGRLSADMECWESITYTTIGDYLFMGHLATIVKR